MVKKIDLQEIQKTAENYYRDGEFYCSEAVLKTLIDAFEMDITDDVIKMASGFPVGIGGKGCTCGAISGGIMFIGLVFGRKIGRDTAVNKAMELSANLHRQFTQAHSTACCRLLTKGMTLGSTQHMQQCISFTGEIAYKTASIVSAELSIETI